MRVLLAILMPVLVATGTTPAEAASIVVDSTADGAPANDGSCTLREAILNADNGNQSGSTDCLAGSGADAVTFTVTGAIVLTAQLPAVLGDLQSRDPGSRSVAPMPNRSCTSAAARRSR